jgi:hypothetical protein
MFEVVWFRVLVLVFGSTVYSFSAMLSMFLLGIAAGSLVVGRLADQYEPPVRLLVLVQGAVALFVVFGGLAVNAMPGLFLRVISAVGITFEGMNETKLLLSFLYYVAANPDIIIADELCSGSRTMYDPVVVEEWTLDGMLAAIADRYLMPCTCPSFSPNLDREEGMLRRVRDFNAEGAIFHVLRGCHLNSLDATKADRVLRRNRIPMLKVESEYDEGDLEQVRTRIEAFIEMIKARREQSG